MTAPRRLALADEFWLMAHHDYSGKPLCAVPVVGAGLAAAVLGELWMFSLVNVAQGRVVADARQSPPADPVWRLVLGELTAQPVSYPLREWISHLAGLVIVPVSDRLVAGQLVEAIRAGFGKKKYVAVDPAIGSSPGVLLHHKIEMGDQLDYQTALLAGLTLVSGLADEIVSTDPTMVRNGLRDMVRQLPPDLLALLGALQSVVAAVPLRINR